VETNFKLSDLSNTPTTFTLLAIKLFPRLVLFSFFPPVQQVTHQFKLLTRIMTSVGSATAAWCAVPHQPLANILVTTDVQQESATEVI
jgi:hypothetical protein